VSAIRQSSECCAVRREPSRAAPFVLRNAVTASIFGAGLLWGCSDSPRPEQPPQAKSAPSQEDVSEQTRKQSDEKAGA